MKGTYQTQQRRMLLDCFRNNSGRQLTVDELIAAMGDAAPGRSTAYRLVKKLCDEGLVRRLTREDTRQAVYQLEGHSCCAEHLHIKCVDCGLLIHLDEKMQEALCANTGFVIDDERSMLYGRCARCAEARGR